jgi:cytochrome c553
MKSAALFPFALSLAFLLAACQTSPAPSAGTERAAVAGISYAKAQSIAYNCFTCHGPGGRSPGTIPSLSRLSAEKIESSLKAFKNGTEPSTVMGRHAKAYTDAEIAAVANYIASLQK